MKEILQSKKWKLSVIHYQNYTFFPLDASSWEMKETDTAQ